MRVLVTGGRGMLGKSVLKKFREKGHVLFVADLPETDILDSKSVENCFLRSAPDAVVHAAAYTDVERAETDKERAFAVNGLGTENVAKAARKYGAKFLYISTDYVFSGGGSEPWKTEDKPAPVNTYGESKAKGEEIALKCCEKTFIVRTAWLYGEGKNFLSTMLELGLRQDKIPVVCDQIGSPTYTDDLSVFLSELIETEKYGIYHATGKGYCSWAQLAKELFTLAANYDERYRQVCVEEILSEEFSSKAKRPKNGRLDTSKLKSAGFKELPPYTDGVKRYLEWLWNNVKWKSFSGG